MGRPFIDAGPVQESDEITQPSQGAVVHPALRELIEAAQADRAKAAATVHVAQQQAQQTQMQAAQVLAVALKALGQKALIALASLFTLLTVASAFVLWLLVPDPNVTQLVGMGMYATFILFVNLLIVWRKP